MGQGTLDEVDRGILRVLQEDCRNISTEEIGNRVGVSASTVRNRIRRLEREEIIRGYRPVIDYERAGYPLRLLLVCTVPATEEDPFSNLLDLRGIVSVRQTLTSRRNLYVEVICVDAQDVSRITDNVAEMGAYIESMDVLQRERRTPFDPDAGDGSRK